jgi:hypothetical protein
MHIFVELEIQEIINNFLHEDKIYGGHPRILQSWRLDHMLSKICNSHVPFNLLLEEEITKRFIFSCLVTSVQQRTKFRIVRKRKKERVGIMSFSYELLLLR